jgi:hypothetical protein
MGSNLIGQLAWATLGLVGLLSIVDLGFGPIVICPQCGLGPNLVLGVGLITMSAAAFVSNGLQTGSREN